VAAVTSATSDLLGRASWLVLVLLALAVVPVLLVRAVIGVRPAAAAPDVASLELATGVMPRQPTLGLAGEPRSAA
jgi:hypothetical protein